MRMRSGLCRRLGPGDYMSSRRDLVDQRVRLIETFRISALLVNPVQRFSLVSSHAMRARCLLLYLYSRLQSSNEGRVGRSFPGLKVATIDCLPLFHFARR